MIASITNWITNVIPGFLIKVYNILIDFLQFLFDGLMDFGLIVVGWFPSGTPLPDIIATPTGVAFDKFIQVMNWVFPLSYCASLVSFVLSGVLGYVAIAPVARWLKLLS